MTKHLLLGSGGQRLYLSSSGVDSACKAEVSKKLGLKQVSLLLDLTCFYDLVDHNLLAEDALSLVFRRLFSSLLAGSQRTKNITSSRCGE
jgi:hypothetical protein